MKLRVLIIILMKTRQEFFYSTFKIQFNFKILYLSFQVFRVHNITNKLAKYVFFMKMSLNLSSLGLFLIIRHVKLVYVKQNWFELRIIKNSSSEFTWFIFIGRSLPNHWQFSHEDPIENIKILIFINVSILSNGGRNFVKLFRQKRSMLHRKWHNRWQMYSRW